MSRSSNTLLGRLDRHNQDELSAYMGQELARKFQRYKDELYSIIEMREYYTASRPLIAAEMQVDALRTFADINPAAASEYEEAVQELNGIYDVYTPGAMETVAAAQASMEIEEIVTFKNLIEAGKTGLQTVFSPFIARAKYHARIIGQNANKLKGVKDTLLRVKDLNRKGWGEVAKQMQNEEDLGLEFVRQLEATAGELEAYEVARLKNDLGAVSNLVSIEEREEAIARILSPSYRHFISADYKMAQIAGEVEGVEALTGTSWIAAKVSASVSQRTGKFIQLLENKFGQSVVGEGARLANAAFNGVSAVTEFTFSVVAPIAEVGIVVYDAITSHNFTEFVTSVFEFFTFGLFESVEFWKIKEYPDNGSIVPVERKGKEDKKTFEEIMLQDSQYTMKEIDVFGELWIRLQNIQSKDKLDPYRPSKLPRIYKKVPMKYFPSDAVANPPLLTQEEIDKSKEKEVQYEKSILEDTRSSYASLVDPVFPRKRGYVRNLHAYPMFDDKINWPSLDGIPVMMDTKYHRSSYDPRIVDLFERWARTGKYGPVYNTGKTNAAREAGIRANQLDYYQFRAFSKDRDGLGIIIANWARSASGKNQVLKAAPSYMDRHTLVDLYVSWERDHRSDRSAWAYLTQPHIFPLMLQELEYYTHVLCNESKAHLFDIYLRHARGVSRPLNMNMYRRVKYMADFARLAYAEEENLTLQFYDEVFKQSGGFLEDTVISSSSHIRSHRWYNQRIKEITHPVSFDLATMLGDITVRMFVLGDPRVAILVFKGTSTELVKGAGDWILDMAFLASGFVNIDTRSNSYAAELMHKATNDNVQVHYGFIRAWLTLQRTVINKLKKFQERHDIEDIYCVGHSLGAAIASIAAVCIPNSVTGKGRPHCYTYACPKIGNAAFVNLFHRRVSESVTSYIDGDFVTMVPPALIPSKNLYPNDHVEVYKKLFDPKSRSSIGSAFSLLGEAMGGNALSKIDFPDISGIFANGKFSISGALNAATSISKSLANLTAYRPANTYIRLHYLDTTGSQFYESSTDPQSTANTIKSISLGVNDKDRLLEYHKMENILQGLEAVATNHPDLFDVNKTDLPEWYAGNSIGPIPPAPGPAPGPPPPKGIVMPPKISKLLENPNTKVIGLARHKRAYRAWSVVNKQDIEETSILYFPIDGKVFEQRYNRSKRRKSRKKKDETY